MPPTIRRMHDSDIDFAIEQTQREGWDTTAAIFGIHLCHDPAGCFVAELDGKVIGFMISYILTLGFGIEKSAWIATLGINPSYMGQGIGAGLAKEVFRFYRDQGVRDVYTSVRWDSTDLLSFFKTLGFDRSNFVNLRKALQ